MANDKSTLMLVVSIINIALLTIGQYYALNWLILVTLMSFCFLFIVSDVKLLFPLLLFHLPWVEVLKFSGAAYSGSNFYTIVIVLVLIRLALLINKDININLIILAVCFLTYVLMVRFARGVPLQTNFLHFAMSFVLTTLFLADRKNFSNFPISAMFFSLGLLLSCFASYFLIQSSPNMQSLLNFDPVYFQASINIKTIRQSGFLLDPNIYSSYIIVAIACILVLLKNSRSFRSMLSYFALLGAFIFFGLTSISKMFLLVAMIIGPIWIASLLISKQKVSYKFEALFLVVVLIVILAQSESFVTLFEYYSKRLAEASDVARLTTDRSTIQLYYIDYIMGSFSTLLFGEGFTYKILYYAGGNIHNSFIEIIYEAGLVGTFLLGVYFYLVTNVKRSHGEELTGENRLLTLIFVMGYFLPWLALDVIFFYQFFFFMILMVYLLHYFSGLQKVGETNSLILLEET